MKKNTSYKIQFFHGLKNLKNEKIYTYVNLEPEEYEKIRNNLLFQLFLSDVEEAYEKIIYNYRDYEKNNYSIVLNHTLKIKDSLSIQSIKNSIDRHISNIVTSTYIYTCLLRKSEKDNNLENIYKIKDGFQELANNYHATNYNYTFVDSLRHKLNHGRNLSKLTTLGSTWSKYWEESENDKNLIMAKKDKKLSLLDMKVTKEEAKNIIKSNHYNVVESKIPNIFYLRSSIRIYINLLSTAHHQLRENSLILLNESNEIISSNLSRCDGYITAAIVKFENETEKEKMNLFSYLEKTGKAQAPLYIEHHPMPGEFEQSLERMS